MAKTYEDKLETARLYKLSNPEKIKSYLEKNKEKIKERHRLYRVKNKEKISEYNRQYRLKQKQSKMK